MYARFIKYFGFILTLWLVSGWLVACQPIQAESTKTQTSNLSAEEQFKQVVLAKEAAYYANDLDQYLAFFSDDTVSMPPGARPTVGKAALATDMREFFSQYKVSGHVTLMSVEVHGDYATRTLQAWDTWTPKAGGDVVTQTGSCVAGWKKINGEWKLVWELWNTEPLPPQ